LLYLPEERRNAVTSYGGRKRASWTNSFHQALLKGHLIPVMSAETSWFNHMLKAVPLNAIKNFGRALVKPQ
jgi:hypothetical protein